MKLNLAFDAMTDAVTSIKNPFLLKNIYITAYNASHADKFESQMYMNKAMGNDLVRGADGHIMLPNNDVALVIINYYMDMKDSFFWYIMLLPRDNKDIDGLNIKYNVLTNALHDKFVGLNSFALAKQSGKCSTIADIYDYIQRETVTVTVMLDEVIVDKKDIRLTCTNRSVTLDDLLN